MAGIPDHFCTEVRQEDQDALVAAFPEIRILWNAKLKLYQIAHREEGWREGFYGSHGDGVLEGWALIPPDYPPPLVISRVINELRIREAMQREMAEKEGCATIAEVVEKAWAKAEAKRAEEQRERFDDRYDFTWNKLFAPRIWSLPKGPGAKEKAKREQRATDAVLREGRLVS